MRMRLGAARNSTPVTIRSMRTALALALLPAHGAAADDRSRRVAEQTSVAPTNPQAWGCVEFPPRTATATTTTLRPPRSYPDCLANGSATGAGTAGPSGRDQQTDG